jgi:hypothetical protein
LSECVALSQEIPALVDYLVVGVFVKDCAVFANHHSEHAFLKESSKNAASDIEE